MTRIHVRRDLVAKDKRDGVNNGQALAISPVIGVETTGMRKRYGRSVTLHGPSRVIYRPDKPLHCGARAWIETDYQVTVHK